MGRIFTDEGTSWTRDWHRLEFAAKSNRSSDGRAVNFIALCPWCFRARIIVARGPRDKGEPPGARRYDIVLSIGEKWAGQPLELLSRHR